MDKNDLYFYISAALALVGIIISLVYVANRRSNRVVIRNNKMRDGDIVGGDKTVYAEPKKK